MARALKTVPHVQRHKDGTVWATGQTLDGEMHGYWEWFRKDGVRMRSGHFDRGAQTGEWVTYDKTGKPHKVTVMKPSASNPPARKSAAKKPAAKKPAATTAARKPAAKSAKPEPTADEFMAALDHPLKAEFEEVRRIILSVDVSISDGVKWNSLSFRTTEWFATVNLRSLDQVMLVMHLGAKGTAARRLDIPDPKCLLDWKSNERALASLGSGNALKANRPALRAIIKAWIKAV